MPTDEQYLEAAWSAAPHFGFEPSDISILAVAENLVCTVTLPDDEKVVMRLHRPGYNSLEALESEVVWVRSLADHGLPVPGVIPLVDGGHYLEVEVGDERRHVGVIEWIDGRPLAELVDDEDPSVGPVMAAHYARMGELAARIRVHADTWAPPPGFVRRSWDIDGLLGPEAMWGRGWELDSIGTEERELFGRARTRMVEELSSVSRGPDRYGLIHTDLHRGNVMADGDDLTIIDFDDAGYGWFAYELAAPLRSVLDEPWDGECRAAMLDGYRSVHPLGEDEVAMIDTLISTRCLMIVGWLHQRPELEAFQRFDEVVTDTAEILERWLNAR